MFYYLCHNRFSLKSMENERVFLVFCFIFSKRRLCFYDFKSIFESSSEWVLINHVKCTINIWVTQAHIWKLFPEIFKSSYRDVMISCNWWENLRNIKYFFKTLFAALNWMKVFWFFYYISVYLFCVYWEKGKGSIYCVFLSMF